MASNNVQHLSDTSTGLQLHVSKQLPEDSNVLDFSEHRIRKVYLESNVYGKKTYNKYFDLLTKYKNGEIAIAWRGGRLTYVKMINSV
jgi:hypothetical protein